MGLTASVGRDTCRVRLRCRAICSRMFAARGDVSDSGIRQVRRLGWHLIHRGAVPLPLNRGRLNAAPRGECVLQIPASEALPRSRTAGGCSSSRVPAGRSPSPPGIHAPDTLWGRLEGFLGERNPSTQFPARTAASDGQRAFTRAARSAGLDFAVILLSKALDVGRDHLIHRKRSPFPYEGKDLRRLRWA